MIIMHTITGFTSKLEAQSYYQALCAKSDDFNVAVEQDYQVYSVSWFRNYDEEDVLGRPSRTST